MADFYSMSFWMTDPRERKFGRELKMMRDFLGLVRDGFPDADIVYKIGNHEERYIRYMTVKAPELLSVSSFDFEEITHCNKYNVKVVGDKRIVKIGYLNAIHGHEFGKGTFSPVNPARTFFLKGKEHCIGAHFHQTSQHSEKTMNEDVIGCWSIGCVSDLHPDYRPINAWNHGFALVERDGHKFEVSNKKIIDGKVYGS